MEQENSNSQQLINPQKEGTLAIDLGNSTTVVAFQGKRDSNVTLLDLPPITRLKGEVPSLVWHCPDNPFNPLVGNEVSNLKDYEKNDLNLSSDFKRWICSPNQSSISQSILTPEEAGELLILEIWKCIPKQLIIKRLVLTAPVETYKEYRSWLVNVCSQLQVNEIALVDEPTAAAMGAGLPPGSKLLVIDIGGSTIDFSLVALEGGEGKAEPVAQLLRCHGQNLEGKSNQVLRCAKVLGKGGQRIGGRDIDKWIANYLSPNEPMTESILNAAERLKCRLSERDLKETKILIENFTSQITQTSQELRLSKIDLERLIKEKGLLKSLDKLFEHTLASAKLNGCAAEDLKHVVLVGGGSRIPLVKSWLKEKCSSIPLLTPPSIEAVAIGALSLTPGVTIRDVLQKGVSIRCWDQKNNVYMWHPLFLAGQPWPTSKPLEIVLATSKTNQKEIELKIGEPEFQSAHEVIYIDGIPTIKTGATKPIMKGWEDSLTSILLSEPGQPGEDCLKLRFSIDKNCQLKMDGIDLRNNNEIDGTVLGLVR